MKHKIILSAIATLFIILVGVQTVDAKHRGRCRQNRCAQRPMFGPQVRVVIAPPMMRPHCGTRVQSCGRSYRGHHRGNSCCNHRRGGGHHQNNQGYSYQGGQYYNNQY